MLVYYLPATTKNDQRMSYAAAKELMRNTAETGRIIEIESAEEMVGIEERLKTEA